MAVSVPTARLNKAGDRVLCGDAHCGRAVAFISETEIALRPLLPADSSLPTGATILHVRQVYFECGFTRGEDGVWRMGRHAADRVRNRRRSQGRRVREDMRWNDDTGSGHSRGIIHPAPESLPALVQCPPAGGCGRVNTLAPEPLQLTVDGALILPPRSEHPGRVLDLAFEREDEPLCSCCKRRPSPRCVRLGRWLAAHPAPDLAPPPDAGDDPVNRWLARFAAELRAEYRSAIDEVVQPTSSP